MTRFRSSPALLALILLAGCAASSGVPVAAIAQAPVAAAYIPLHKGGLVTGDGAAMVIAPGIAVTNAHNRNLLASAAVIGASGGYDLLFFRHAGAPPPMAEPRIGEAVTAYGQGLGGDLRAAHGVVRRIKSGEGAAAYFIFAGDAGPGFSGGPVLDESGRLVGITFGYKDAPKQPERLIYAYDMARVMAELSALQNTAGAPKNNQS